MAYPRFPHLACFGLILALLLPSLTFSQTEEKLEIRDLGKCGLTTRYASSQIGDTCLVEAENIYLDEDVGISRRKGFSRFNTTALQDSLAVRGIWPFRATDGTNYMVVLSSRTMFQSSGNGTFAAISPALAGLSATQNMDCTQCLGRLWCVNGSDTMFFWTGSSTGTASGAPTCQAIDCFRNRLILANCSGTLSQLRLSGELDGTDYTIPATAASTSPAVISLGGANDGNEVRCIQGVYQDVLVAGKQDSTWGLYGFDRRDFAVREISREVGCIDNRSGKEKQGSLYWLSNRGVEKMTGPSIMRVSDPIRDLMDTIIVAGGNSRSAQDTSQTDFEAGNLTASGAGAPISAIITSASIVPSSTTLLYNTTTLFALGTCSGCAIGNRNEVTFSGVTSSYVYRYEGDVVPQSDGWTVVENMTGVTESVSASTYTIIFSLSGTVETGYRQTRSVATQEAMSMVARAQISPTPPRTARLEIGFVDALGRHMGIVSISSDIVRYQITQQSPQTDTIIGAESITQPSYSTYTVLITSSASAQSVYFWRDGVFKSSGVTTAAAGTVSVADIRFVSLAGSGTQLANANIPFFYVSTSIINPGISDIVSVATFTTLIYNTGVSTPVFSVLAVTSFPVTGTTLSYSIRTSTSANDDQWTSYIPIGNGVQPYIPSGRQYIQFRSTFSHFGFVEAPSITRVSLPASTTGYFISQCRNPGTAITSWGLFQCNRVLNNGDMTFYVSTGTTCNGATRTTNTWTTQTNNSVITIATAAFVAYRVLFDIDLGTDAPTLNDCTINWNEGTTRPPVTSEVYRDRYYMAYTSGTTGTVVNDRMLVLDSRDQWVLHSEPNCSALSLYNRNLYCGDSGSNGRVYQIDVGQDDDGASFTSNIRTKDFDFGNTWQRKVLSRMYFDLAGLPSQDVSISLTPSYTLDASTDVFTLTNINLNEDYSRFIAAKVPALLSNNVTGRWFNFALSNTGSAGPWKIFGFNVVFSRLTED